jgi:hypothetical protein
MNGANGYMKDNPSKAVMLSSIARDDGASSGLVKIGQYRHFQRGDPGNRAAAFPAIEDLASPLLAMPASSMALFNYITAQKVIFSINCTSEQ